MENRNLEKALSVVTIVLYIRNITTMQKSMT